MAGACVSCSDQWKVRAHNKICGPFTEACGPSSSCAPGRFGQGTEGYLSGVIQHQRERQFLGKGLVQVPVIYPTCPSQCRGAGRHWDQTAPPVSKHMWYNLSPCSPSQTLWWRDLWLLTLWSLGCSLGDFSGLVPKYLAAGMPSLASVPRKGHPDLPVHQAGSSRRKKHYTSLTVWLQLILTLLVCLITCHSPCSTVKTRKQAERSK